MPKFKKKDAISVEAVQWTGQNHSEVLSLIAGFTVDKKPKKEKKKATPEEIYSDDNALSEEVAFSQGSVFIRTPTGDLQVDQQDWLIKGANGEFYASKPDLFIQSYEAEASPAV